MPSERKFFKHTFKVTVISEDSPLPDFTDLKGVHLAITDGDCIGGDAGFEVIPITPKQAADLCYELASEPGFFGLDDEGNDADEEEEG